MAVPKAKQNDQSKTRETTSIRDRAADSTSLAPGRGPVDAPGKRHRKPQPKEPIDKRMGEPRGKQMGQKSVKNGPRGGRH